MILDAISSISISPAAEALSQAIEIILELVIQIDDVLIEKKSFVEFRQYLERIIPILKGLNKKDFSCSDSLNNALEILNREVKVAKELTVECCNKNKVYLLMNCRSIVQRLENSTREISRALSLIPLASLDLSSGIIEEIEKLCDNMGTAEFRAAIAEEEILQKIEIGIQERTVDRSYANSLLVLIAQTLGISTEQSTLKKEFEDFKEEINSTHVRKNKAEAIQMDQIIALLGRADAASSRKEKEMKYFIKRNSLGSQPLEPLLSFYCPITRDVMTDPVETSSGQTFERSAIEKWLADGNELCPLTMTPLDTSILRPNKTLRQSIEEWRDRNTMIKIASIKPKLLVEGEEEVLNCLEQLQDLCEQRDLHQEWVVLENYSLALIKLLGEKNREIRIRALLILCILAKNSDDSKVFLSSILHMLVVAFIDSHFS